MSHHNVSSPAPPSNAGIAFPGRFTDRLSAANGLPPIPVAVNGQTSYDFAVASRQVFSKVTGDYVDFPSNGTTEIITDVVSPRCRWLSCLYTASNLYRIQTLGALHSITIPVTFRGYVFLDYNSDCTIDFVRAFAEIPTEVANIMFTSLGYPAPYPSVLSRDLSLRKIKKVRAE
jgi:hypothetical protein